MRMRRNFLICTALTFATIARADDAANVVMIPAAVMAGAAAGSATAAPYQWNPLPLPELETWDLPEGTDSSRIVRQCGLLAEARISGYQRSNFFFVMLKNITNEAVTVQPHRATMRFDNGRERNPMLYTQVNDVELKAGWRLAGYLQFPEKSDFEGANRVTLRLPVHKGNNQTPCWIEIALERDASRPIPPESVQAYTQNDIGLAVGASFLRSAQLKEQGSAGLTLDVVAHRYWGLHHGYFVNLIFETYSNNGPLAVAVGGLSDRAVTGLGIYGGYSFRQYFSENSDLVVDVGLGLHGLLYTPLSTLSRTSFDSFSVEARVAYDYFFGSSFWRMAVGPDLFLLWLPFNKATFNTKGISAGALIHAKFAY